MKPGTATDEYMEAMKTVDALRDASAELKITNDALERELKRANEDAEETIAFFKADAEMRDLRQQDYVGALIGVCRSMGNRLQRLGVQSPVAGINLKNVDEVAQTLANYNRR